MKKLILASCVLLSFSAFAAPKCILEIKDTVRMPNGPENFPTVNLANLKSMGYSPKLVIYPSTKPGTYSMETEVKCGNLIFNPWVSNCSTVVTIFDADSTFVAQGTSTNNVAVGVYSADLDGAIAKLPKCADLK